MISLYLKLRYGGHMLRFAASLTTLYGELPFEERFSAAAEDGFSGVEFMFPYAHEAKVLANLLQQNSLTQALFNVPAGEFTKGERGIASLPGREVEFLDGIKKALEYADIMQCKCLHILCGNIQADVEYEKQFSILLQNISQAADMAAPMGIHFTLEAISRAIAPSYLLERQAQVLRVVQELQRPNVGIQFDIYHCQMTEGNIKNNLLQALPYLKHIQIAGAPHRHEPHKGELDCNFVLNLIDSLEYSGFIGCEYVPEAGTRAGFDWLKPYI